MSRGKIGEMICREVGQSQQDSSLVRGIEYALDQPRFGEPIDQLYGRVVTKPESLGEIADRDRTAAGIALYREQRLMLSRCQAHGFCSILAELQKTPNQIAKLRQRLVI
jgi:hypothetical protein